MAAFVDDYILNEDFEDFFADEDDLAALDDAEEAQALGLGHFKYDYTWNAFEVHMAAHT